MAEKIFVAGATGAIGTVLVPLLLDAGYVVYGSTRQQARADPLKKLGAHPVVVDVFDAATLNAAVRAIAPAAIIHQLTDLPRLLEPQAMAEAVHRNARIRGEGTRNLVAAALAAGSTRMIAQSIAWAYAGGNQRHVEESPLDVNAAGGRRISIDGVVALETQVLHTPKLTGTVLRYGQLYGPGTSTMTPQGASPVHVDAAAQAALLALQRGAVGIFNITGNNADVNNEKAGRVLGWDPAFRAARSIRS